MTSPVVEKEKQIRSPLLGGSYVFSWENELFIKCLQPIKDGVRVISDNDKYEPWEITRKEMRNQFFSIHGRVTGCCQRV